MPLNRSVPKPLMRADKRALAGFARGLPIAPPAR
jgi:hypothetical protein